MRSPLRSVSTPAPLTATTPALSAVLAALSMAAFSMAACSGPAPEPVRAAYPDSEPASSPAFEYLPHDTRFVIAARSASSLADKVQWRGLRTRHSGYERAVAEVTQLIGHNLLEPANLAEVGLDPNKALGLAWVRDEAAVLFAPIMDHDLFQTSVYRTASKVELALIPEVVGTSVIIAAKKAQEWRLVIRGQTALFVVSDDSSEEADAIARGIAAATLDTSLAGNPGFAGAMDDLRFGEDLAGFTSAGILLDSVADDIGVGRDAPIVFGAEIAADALRVKAFVPVAAGAPVRRTLHNSARPSALVRATVAHPLLVLSASVEGSSLSATPLGRKLERPLEELGQELGVDLARELAPLVAGEVGLAVVESEPLRADAGDMFQALGVNALVEVSDPDRVRALLDGAVKRSPLARAIRPGQTAGSYVLAVPDWKELYIGVDGPYLHVSSDPGFANRLTGPAPARPGDAVSARYMSELFAPAGGAAQASLGWSLFHFWMSPMRWAGELHAGGYHPVTEGHDPEVPLSDEHREKLAELEAAQVEMFELQKTLLTREAERQLKLTRAYGASALRVESTPAGLVIYGGQFLGDGGLRHALDTTAEWITRRMQGHDRGEDRELEALSRADERIEALRQELYVIRELDIAEYERSQAPAPRSGDDRSGLAGPEEEPVVQGDLDKNIIRRYIRRSLPRIRYCYEKELAQKPGVGAVDVTVDFVIAADGTVASARATGNNATVAACVEKVMKGIRYPKPRGGGVVQVKYPFKFVPSNP